MKNILLSFWDGGQGHLGRILSIAESIHSNEYTIGILTSGKYRKYLCDIPFIDYVFEVENRKHKIHKPPYSFPIYSHAFRHAQRLNGLEFNDIDFLDFIIKKELQVIDEFKPNIIINDYRDTIKIAAEIKNIPIIGITTSNGNSSGYTMGWWISTPQDMILPDCRDSFNFVRRKYGLSNITDERQSFEGDICIVPSSEFLDPFIVKNEKNIYVGALHNLNYDPIVPSGINNFYIKNKKIVLWYMGEGNNRPFFDFDSIVYDISEYIDAYFIIVGTRDKYPSIPNTIGKRKNIYVKPFLEYGEYRWILENSSAIINHGGCTTLHGLNMGIPFIAIPWNSESNLAIWGSKYGAGIHLPHSIKPLQRVQAIDLGEHVEIMGHWKSDIVSSQLGQALTSVLFDSAYKEKAITIANDLKKYGGFRKVIEIIENMIRDGR